MEEPMFIFEIYKNADPDHIALVGDRTLTYGEMNQQISRYRNVLYKKGVRQGDRIAIYAGNCIQFILAYMAIVSLGAIVVPVNFSLVEREVDYIVKDAGISLLLTDRPLKAVCPVMGLDKLDDLARFGKAGEAPAFPEGIEEDDVCSLVYTSGTTGNPKGAMLSHKNIVRNIQQFNDIVQFNDRDICLCVLPMFHCYGWTVSAMAPLYVGASVVVLNSKNPKEMIHTIEKYKITVAAMVPPMYHLLVRRGDTSAMDSVRMFISGGAPIPQPVSQGFYEKYGHPVLEGYGLTEASPVVSVMHPDQPPKYLTVGPAISDVEVKVRTKSGGPYKPGEVGELMVRGDNVMKGYWHKEEETAKVITPDGWLHTGDLVYMDKDGYIYIVDRIKDLIIVNGENIYPGEVEDCLYEIPEISECAVVGHSDSLRGQAVWAYIVMKDGCPFDEDSIRHQLLKNLAAYKVPRRFIPMDELPKNSTGKILKRALRK